MIFRGKVKTGVASGVMAGIEELDELAGGGGIEAEGEFVGGIGSFPGGEDNGLGVVGIGEGFEIVGDIAGEAVEAVEVAETGRCRLRRGRLRGRARGRDRRRCRRRRYRSWQGPRRWCCRRRTR